MVVNATANLVIAERGVEVSKRVAAPVENFRIRSRNRVEEVKDATAQRLRAQLDGVMNCLAVSQQEVERLRSGKFTPEEFQNLCHEFSDDDRQAFFDGCAEYQRKLFGVCDRDTATSSDQVARQAAQAIVADRLALPGMEEAIAGIVEAQLRSAAVPQAEQWQSMESAPKGIDVLLVWEDRHQQIERLNDKPSFWFENTPIGWRHLPAGPCAAPVATAVTEDKK